MKMLQKYKPFPNKFPGAVPQQMTFPPYNLAIKFISANLFFSLSPFIISVILPLLLFLTIISCSKSGESDANDFENAVDPRPFVGMYSMEPTAGQTLSLDQNGRASVYDLDGSVILDGRFITGTATLKIFFSGTGRPDAVFLLNDYTKEEWRGRWGNEIKILHRK